MHLIGVVSSNKRGGADSPYLPMSKGNDTLGCAAGKVGRGTFVMRVVGGPAVPAAPIVGAVAGFVSRVLAVALKAVDVGRKCSLAFPKRATRWGPWVFYCSPLEAILSFTVFWVAVRRSLRHMNARDDAAGRGSGMSAKEMGDQACPNRCMCQVAFHLVLFLFSFELLSP